MRSNTEELVFKAIFWIVAGLTIAILAVIVIDVLGQGLRSISVEFFTQNPRGMGTEGGIFSTIVSTVYLIVLSLAIATPIGVGAAVFLAEYKQRGRFLQLIHFTTESLAGIPSIIFGVFGFSFFVLFLKMGWSILSGSLTLALMILPTLVRTAEEAIVAVPNTYREGSIALGASKWQTIVRMVIPAAMPGIVTGMILAVGRAVGESAAVILTAGSALGVPRTLLDPGRSMAVHLYVLAVEGLSMERAYATAAVLIIAIALVNFSVNLFTARQRAQVK